MTSEFVPAYRRAIACYSDESFAEFFRLADITDPDMQAIGKDYLGVAGGFYLSQMDQSADRPIRSDTITHLKRAQKASRTLSDSLSHALNDSSFSSAFMEGGVKAGRELARSAEPHADTLETLASIFPINTDGKGFRYGGLVKSLEVLADTLEQIEASAIEKTTKSRSRALQAWTQLMGMYWLEAKGKPPTIGHYLKEIGDYDSPSIAALSYAAEQLDNGVSSRLIAKELPRAINKICDEPEELMLLLSLGFSALFAPRVSESGKELLEKWAGMPPEIADYLFENAPEPSEQKVQEGIVSKEEFFETLNSSKQGKMLLQALMALRQE